jgi:hypothetical protein
VAGRRSRSPSRCGRKYHDKERRSWQDVWESLVPGVPPETLAFEWVFAGREESSSRSAHVA